MFLLTFWTVPHFHSGEFLILGDGTPIETIEKSIPVLCDIAHVEHPGSTSSDQLEWLGTGPWAPVPVSNLDLGRSSVRANSFQKARIAS